MAVEVKDGEVYEAKGVRSGDRWSLFKVKAEKGPKELPVFVDRSDAFQEGDKVKVKRITSVRLSAKKGKDDQWRDTVSVNAEVEVVGAASKEFEDIDGELPF